MIDKNRLYIQNCNPIKVKIDGDSTGATGKKRRTGALILVSTAFLLRQFISTSIVHATRKESACNSQQQQNYRKPFFHRANIGN